MAQIKACMKKVDNLIVAVGSAEHKNERRNPFSGAERVRMLRAYLKEMHIDVNKVSVVAVKDYNSYSEAIKNMLTVCNHPDVVFVKDKSMKLAKMASKEVAVQYLPLKRRIDSISSTKLRNAIARGKDWESMTGKSVAGLVKKYGGVRRIKAFSGDN